LLLLVVVIAVAVYAEVRRLTPVFEGTGCRAIAGSETFALDPEQASIAATIAGVAHKQSMPPEAVTIAYAAALQESKMHNLHYGDMDSVGVFQQRPSEGWGSTKHLEDPVYATTKFFKVLATVHDYPKLPVYQAAQDVQHSADGSAYMQYEQMATGLTAVFTGGHAHAVSCWSASTTPKHTQLAAAGRELSRTFGTITEHVTGSRGSERSVQVQVGQAGQLQVGQSPVGWAVAAWLVTHAATYGIHEVRYGGYQWQASNGFHGWTRGSGALPRGVVQLS
jgi:hypothetical protein